MIQILKMRAEDVPELDVWLKRDNTYKWLHHSCVDKILQMMADEVLKQNLELIKSAVYYAIIVFETADCTKVGL